MVVKISPQKARAIANKFLNGAKLPRKGQDGFLLPTGAKLRNSEFTNSYIIICHTYDPKNLELKPLGII